MTYILAKDLISASRHISHLNRLIHENQMNLMIVWYHYCFYAYFGLVVAYDMSLLNVRDD